MVTVSQKHVVAMVDWAQAYRQELLDTLGPPRPRLPSPATWRRVLLHIDMTALERQIVVCTAKLDQVDVTWGAINLRDSMVVRGEAENGKDVSAERALGQYTFLVSPVCHESAYVLAYAVRDLAGTVTIMDALATQRHIAQLTLNRGGRDLMIIKQEPTRPLCHRPLGFREVTVAAPSRRMLDRSNQRRTLWQKGAPQPGYDPGLERVSDLARQLSVAAPH